MRVEIQDDTNECWNRTVIDRYVQQVDAVERRYEDKPDILVCAGRIACSGCSFSENLGRLCTAEMEETVILSSGEPDPDIKLPSHIYGFRQIEPQQRAA